MKYFFLTLLLLLGLPLMSTAMPLPNIAVYSDELTQQLTQALVNKGKDYVPRTHHLDKAGQPLYTNRLILEKSPYLWQHAHNPVNWFPWGKEAFALAKAENKPIFLSIGYATCHWCHVMEEESFENKQIASFLNEHFIAIKVDRETHPAIDELYMQAVILVSGHGGWPMSSFLLPDGKSFFGGTYFPPQRFLQLLTQIQTLWVDNPLEIRKQANKIASDIQQIEQAQNQVAEIGENIAQTAVEILISNHDDMQGGFGDAPKFPQEPLQLLLLDKITRDGDHEALTVLNTNLHAMAQGGLYDRVGGGFHRYATDSAWLVPHFEKMLYNQGQLVQVYTRAWQVTHKPFYQRIVTQTLDYCLREMQTPAGGFYSATDADSEGEEGLFFVWTTEQLQAVLTADEAKFAIALFNVVKGGNFEGKSILYLPTALEKIAQSQKISEPQLYQKIDRVLKKLRKAREKRPHPLRDDKVIVAWNAMLITGLVQAGATFNNNTYLNAGIKASNFIWSKQRQKSGLLWRVNLAGEAGVIGALEDYSYYAQALLALYDATGDAIWLQRAMLIVDTMLAEFWDDKEGGFFISPVGSDLMLRLKKPEDNAISSGNSMALQVLTQLSQRTDQPRYHDKALALVKAFSNGIKNSPVSYAYMLTGLENLLKGEAGALQYAGKGGVKIQATLNKQADNHYEVQLKLQLPSSWHINARPPLPKGLIPTQVSLANNSQAHWAITEINYPVGAKQSLAFSDTPLPLYSDNALITLQLRSTTQPQAFMGLQIRLQACNDTLCLPPETVDLQLWAQIDTPLTK